ncbi:hypothetical protein FH584_03130 [Leptospira interrogans]|nr:hypothetical protein [Leptospira interrogans]ULG92923.1 hypothetical protein FH584_03130 [Leptospira interrogans]
MKLCFALIPTFKESICKVQITAFFGKVNHEQTHVITTWTHENSIKLLTAEFTKKIAVFKKYCKFKIMAF